MLNFLTFKKRALIACTLIAVAGFAVVKPAVAQSEASLELSFLPIASVAVVGVSAGAASATVLAAPVVLSAAGAVFVVKSIELSGRATVFILERASDGVRLSLTVASDALKVAGLSVGTAVTASVIGSGIVLIASGYTIAFVPNELGKILLHNQRVY
jgi:hypothetical protein